MSLALSICVLLISLMQIVNGTQFLNITFLLVLFASASAAAVLLLSHERKHHYNHINIVCSS